MAIAASLLRSEMRRHLLMNISLVASCVVGGTVVTNERGLFVPLSHGMSETARAFAAMFTQSHLLPDNTDLTDVRMVSPLSPFEVTADSRDLRRRLMDSLSWLPEEAQDYNKELAQISDQRITPMELADNAPNTFANTAPASQPAAASSTTPVSRPTPADTLPSQQQLSSPEVTQKQVQDSTPPPQTPTPQDDTGAVPEPSSWAMLIAGFGLVGYFLRASRRRQEQLSKAAEVSA